MQLRSGMVSLGRLIDYAKNIDPQGDSLHGKSSAGRAYGKLAKGVATQIVEEAGVYRWGRYGVSGEWEDIYIGRAFKSKTANLRARILEELKDEKHFLWRAVYSAEQLLKLGEGYYPQMWFRYQQHWRLALEKTGATHIAWVAIPELNARRLQDLEAALISAFLPSGNKIRPLASALVHPKLNEVITHFEETIK